ncbi:MAG: MmcQ/YjbR family DNA-binding protein [Terriglobales bacterium]
MPDVDSIRALCLSLPDATENIQWGDDLCFKVRGKIFTTVALSDGRYPRLCFKCAPDKFDELLEIDGISPAPYVGRYKWVLVEKSNLLPANEIESLIRQSYELVVAKAPAPKKKAVRSKSVRKKSSKSRV